MYTRLRVNMFNFERITYMCMLSDCLAFINKRDCVIVSIAKTKLSSSVVCVFRK